MRNSSTIKDVKIPYPTEGIVRTVAIDDTVAPQNSVQVAVNLNFDQIGAMKTRLGLTEYADDVTGEVVSFGKLNNDILPDGYLRMTNFLDSTEFESVEMNDVAITLINSTTFLVIWSGDSTEGFAAVYSADSETGEFTLETGPTKWSNDASSIRVIPISLGTLSYFLIVFQGPSSDGFAQVMKASTFGISMEGSPVEFDNSDFSSSSLAEIDNNHFTVFYRGVDSDGFAKVLEVNLSTWAVTVVGAGLEFDTNYANDISCAAVGDGEHVVVFWESTVLTIQEGHVQCFEVDTGTWNITANGTPFVFETSSNSYNSCAAVGDGEHFINFWKGSFASGGLVQVFNLNLSTFAVTALSTPFKFDEDGYANACIATGDGQHFINTWRELPGTVPYQAYIQTFEINLTTFAVVSSTNKINFSEIGSESGGRNTNAVIIGEDYRPVVAWMSSDETEGSLLMFKSTGLPESFNWLYVQQENGDVLNWDNPGWTTRRTSLNPEYKARFVQFLNYIWMVNGSAFKGGDPVQTSNGGDFGTDLVPDNFPPGDFIQAGFEGRVWVADKVFDTVYFTDIVQFTPPDFYELTYDPDKNFIKNFSPQNGQTITGFITTPRALLLFKQDSIYRIYGAYNVDAYPAYNVGTYSEESIIQTKDGIFFHHSSGFYQFNYGGEPIEISRRVIDFIEAIPRAYYENVEGVYDGVDAVLWSIGPVTVEGVAYTNCVMRYTLSTQIWTIYNYPGNDIRALIEYDDGTGLNVLMGTDEGKVNKMDDGFDDLGEIINFEMIDKWRSYTEMYAESKSLNGFNIYHDNGSGVSLQHQSKKQGVNVWEDLGQLDENSNTLMSNVNTEESSVSRLRFVGTSKGEPIVIHGIEILAVDVRGYDNN